MNDARPIQPTSGSGGQTPGAGRLSINKTEIKGDFSSGQITFNLPASVRDNQAGTIGQDQVIAYLRQQGVPASALSGYTVSNLGIQHQGNRRAITIAFNGPGIPARPTASSVGTAGQHPAPLIESGDSAGGARGIQGVRLSSGENLQGVSADCSAIFMGPDNTAGQRVGLTYASEITMNSGGRNITFDVQGKAGHKVNVWQEKDGSWSAEYYVEGQSGRTQIMSHSTRLQPPPKPASSTGSIA
ncbi:hypothetical protein A3K48_00435 [candidate division WOR-1 bacterium RIFOXYA12_FULL_52_29]|uniref:Uncharacterized protein n=1 Tax=candidate division WOR-1 bacterium RIFOXYC12_FULL_54_18 TaxID=1802584 RepID=A0A1F4T4J5_UNCSA|nr:MAG: hypothetical protein A3K44_00435 [candidate division WOR-1 bacterium RIFOXYA2_FULL_51_19]OGC17069.1 MAG: hypothetical protein A3K48_00435 [candidate division WOR-1 bacterium RIFOXYA12_FULL_52_29]OGC25930.1 MAG: hypothetical protein A3K32_00435 [candidate division WOR-1 bacterium RIFOXYB2_FULL_45_9]OGC27486.1 MAG: hypothetical protein A3K49_00435 [candidate division WOR-1 bacterium RIFOXYC12_FULL_54_18]OGC29301.1 MAG: hypothetical protein A2346_01270 [candidate division WOR-1 bacterium R